ncbi:MAG: ATP-dependent Clp protease adapter ClpS [Desulfobacterales bacterium]|nr:ATP-dependent Clp protease adapter ClpS [Desulfobacterales bacterium]
MTLQSPEVKEREKVKEKPKNIEPPMYKVILHNDDYTPMEFVVEILMYVFLKPLEEATLIMLNIHKKGIGICGVYTFEMAETKIEKVHALSQERSFPLRCSMEKL